MSANKDEIVNKDVVKHSNSEVNKTENVDKELINIENNSEKEIPSPEEEALIAEEKALKAEKRKETINKVVKDIGEFLWKTVNIKILFIIIVVILTFALGFYAGEENYKRVLRNNYEKAVEDFSDTWEKEWKDAFDN